MAPSPPVRAAVIWRSRRWRSSWRASSSSLAGVASSWPARMTSSATSRASSASSAVGGGRVREVAAEVLGGEAGERGGEDGVEVGGGELLLALLGQRDAEREERALGLLAAVERPGAAPLAVARRRRRRPRRGDGLRAGGRAAPRSRRDPAQMPSRLDDELDEVVAEDALRQRRDDRADLRSSAVALVRAGPRSSDALDLEARERDRARRAARASRSAPPSSLHDVGRVAPGRQPDDPELDAALRRASAARALSRATASWPAASGSWQNSASARGAASALDLLGGQRRAHRADRLRHARLVQRDHVGVALDQHHAPGLAPPPRARGRRRRRSGPCGRPRPRDVLRYFGSCRRASSRARRTRARARARRPAGT